MLRIACASLLIGTATLPHLGNETTASRVEVRYASQRFSRGPETLKIPPFSKKTGWVCKIKPDAIDSVVDLYTEDDGQAVIENYKFAKKESDPEFKTIFYRRQSLKSFEVYEVTWERNDRTEPGFRLGRTIRKETPILTMDWIVDNKWRGTWVETNTKLTCEDF